MSYKASFAGGEVWNGTRWIAMPARELDDQGVQATLDEAEEAAMDADGKHFRMTD